MRAYRPVGGARFVLYAVTLACAASLSGCSQSAEPTQADTPKHLRLGVGLPPGAPERLAGTFVADGLFGLGLDGRPVERVISNFEWTEDLRGLKIKLRPGLKWHNGSAVEMGQLKHTILAAIKEPFAPVSLQSITDVVVDPKHPDTATINLSRPEAFLRMAYESFNYSLLGAVGFETLGPIVERCTCYEMRYGDVAASMDALGEVLRVAPGSIVAGSETSR